MVAHDALSWRVCSVLLPPPLPSPKPFRFLLSLSLFLCSSHSRKIFLTFCKKNTFRLIEYGNYLCFGWDAARVCCYILYSIAPSRQHQPIHADSPQRKRTNICTSLFYHLREMRWYVLLLHSLTHTHSHSLTPQHSPVHTSYL